MVRTNLRVEGLTVAHANRAARVEANECHNKQGDKACNDSVSEHRRNYIGNILLNKDQKNSTGVPDVHYLRVAGHFRTCSHPALSLRARTTPEHHRRRTSS